MDYSYINENLEQIRSSIEKAALKSGRTASDILLLAVTKTVDKELIQVALDDGITDIGENRVQELMSKYDYLTANWHLIGHLQTNKVKYIIGKVKLIHSVDSYELALEIDKRASKEGLTQDILVEVNIGEEESKFGISYEQTKDFVGRLWDLKSINVKGLMTVAPFVDEAENNRTLFSNMRQLYVDINENRGDNRAMEFLSMGMTGDYEVAIEEGANIVRVGTGIFGRRNY